MAYESTPTLLDRFRCKADAIDSDILITCCPKTIFSVHPDLNRVIKDVFVVYRENRWHLVDGDLYRNRVHVNGLLRADIYDCVDNMGHRFLLVSTYPLSGEVTAWRESVFEVIDTAREDWVRMRRIEGKDGYDVQIMEDILCDPRWSKRSLDDFVMEAFGDNIILPEDLPVHTTVKRNVRSSHTLNF